MMPPTLNCGSLIEPLIGRLMSITPWRSLQQRHRQRTGSLVALGLSTRSPKVSWFSTTWLLASSLPSGCTL